MLRGASLKLLRNVIFQFLDECFLFGKSSGCNVCILNIEHFMVSCLFLLNYHYYWPRLLPINYREWRCVLSKNGRSPTIFTQTCATLLVKATKTKLVKIWELLSIKMRKILWNILSCFSFTLEKRMLSNIGIPFSGNLRNGKVQNTCCSGVAAQVGAR